MTALEMVFCTQEIRSIRKQFILIEFIAITEFIEEDADFLHHVPELFVYNLRTRFNQIIKLNN